MKKTNQILVAGCGRLGSNLAGMLCKCGHRVTVVDRDAAAFRRLAADFSGFEVQGDATDPDVLEAAGIGRAALLAAVTENDNVNCMIAQIAARLYGLGQVYARFEDPELEYLVEGLGVHVICPAELSLQEFYRSGLLAREGAEGPLARSGEERA